MNSLFILRYVIFAYIHKYLKMHFDKLSITLYYKTFLIM